MHRLLFLFALCLFCVGCTSSKPAVVGGGGVPDCTAQWIVCTDCGPTTCTNPVTGFVIVNGVSYPCQLCKGVSDHCEICFPSTGVPLWEPGDPISLTFPVGNAGCIQYYTGKYQTDGSLCIYSVQTICP